MESQQQQPIQEHASPPPPPRPKPPIQVPRSKQRIRVPRSKPPIRVPRSRPPIRVVVSRGYTIIALLTTLILPFILKNPDKETGGAPPPVKAASNWTPHPLKKPPPGSIRAPSPAPQPPFSISGTVGSVLAASVLGAVCNLFQLGMLIYCMVTGKDWTSSKFNLFFNYYIDKAVALLLAANMGVGLGSMLTILQVKSAPFTETKKLHLWLLDHMSLEVISTALLASATISTSVSSTCSAEAIHDYMRAVEKGEKAVGILGRLAAKAYSCCCGP